MDSFRRGTPAARAPDCSQSKSAGAGPTGSPRSVFARGAGPRPRAILQAPPVRRSGLPRSVFRSSGFMASKSELLRTEQ